MPHHLEEQRRELELLRAQMYADAELDSRMVASVVVIGLCVPILTGMLTVWVLRALDLVEVAQLQAHDWVLTCAGFAWCVAVLYAARRARRAA